MMALVCRPWAADSVTNPARSECPDTFFAASSPLEPATADFTIKATDCGVSARSLVTVSWRLTGRNKGPAPMSASSSHRCKALTGQRSSDFASGMNTVLPSPSWSVLDRRISNSRPWACGVMPPPSAPPTLNAGTPRQILSTESPCHGLPSEAFAC